MLQSHKIDLPYKYRTDFQIAEKSTGLFFIVEIIDFDFFLQVVHPTSVGQ